jgi:esterase/lipase superfamily enzyme
MPQLIRDVKPFQLLHRNFPAIVARMTRFSVFLVVALTISACAPRGVLVFGQIPQGGDVQRVYVATNRSPADVTPASGQAFSGERDVGMHYARFDISVPPGHEIGNIEWPARAESVNADRHFVVADARKYARAPDFLKAVEADVPAGRNEVVVMVHGFNVNDAEATYRLAQTAYDYQAELPVISYSWPSAGEAQGYVYDRDSVFFARDSLETLLNQLTENGQDVLLIAHSMGSQLVMETLRQMSIGGNTRPFKRISGVVLISPDIDEEVFLLQAQRIHPFPQPFSRLVSGRARLLNLSALLTGKPERLGSVRNPAHLDGLGVTVIDLTDVEGGDIGGHSTAFTSPEAIRLLSPLMR